MQQIVIPPATPALNVAIIRRAQRDIPILENPAGSNRSPELDAMCKRWGIPLGSYWCALWGTDVWHDAGAEVPPIDAKKDWHPAKAQTWLEWAKATGRFTMTPQLGFAVLYGSNGHAHHFGACVVALQPKVFDLEGNTSLAGYSRNGELTGLKPVDLANLIGYVSPTPLVVRA